MADETTAVRKTETLQKAEDVAEMVYEIVATDHGAIESAKFACFLTDRPMRTFGKVKAVTKREQAWFSRRLDFIITVDKARWDETDEDVRRASIDKLLCSCWVSDDGKAVKL